MVSYDFNAATAGMTAPVKIGISSCLLGNKVRYDGCHSHDPSLIQAFGVFAEFVPVCPEFECGMPVPREAIRLEGGADNPVLVTRETGIDKTDMMKTWIEKRLTELEKQHLCGFIFKGKSPSCGLSRVKVYGDDGKMSRSGTGLFARAFARLFPRVPVKEAEQLQTPELRDDFIRQVFSFMTSDRSRASSTRI